MVTHFRNMVKFMKISFNNYEYYNKNIVELCYTDSNGKKQKLTINKGDRLEFNEEK